MNWDTWNSLPPEIQQVFEDNFEAWSEENDNWEAQSDEAGYTFAEELGNTFVELPAEEIQEFYDLLDANFRAKMAELDAKGYNATAIYEEIRSLVEEHE
jgi:TRAP-type C4-dicarboxylate transport system substrate-binding protein